MTELVLLAFFLVVGIPLLCIGCAWWITYDPYTSE